MTWEPPIFNPLSFESLSKAIANELSQAPIVALDDLPRFEGPGIYALYYTGEFSAYAPLAETNRIKPGTWPIYIGKAEVSTRKGAEVQAPDDYSGDALYKRLGDHIKSIRATDNLSSADFHVRVLVLAYVWVPMAETAAIAMYGPLWNTLIDGFGNHAPGKGRYEQMRSRWDTLHPGRSWAEKLKQNQFSDSQIAEEAKAWLLENAR